MVAYGHFFFPLRCSPAYIHYSTRQMEYMEKKHNTVDAAYEQAAGIQAEPAQTIDR